MTAVERAQEMMRIPMGQLPPLALGLAKKLCSEVGMCMEVMLTAYAVYAQVIEGLSNDDDLYEARPGDRAWLLEQQAAAAANT